MQGVSAEPFRGVLKAPLSPNVAFNRKRNMKLKSPIWVLAISLSLCSCGPTSQQWGEEVQLSDGRVIVITRQSILESGGDEWVVNRSGAKLKEVRLSFAWPDRSGQTVEWKSSRSADTWPEKALILDIEAGQPVVFSRVSTGVACKVYLKYRYEQGDWKQHRLPDQFEQRPTNLLIRDGIDMPKFVTLQEKSLANALGSYRPSLRHVGPNRKICD